MFSHVFLGVEDFDRALRFYTPVMQALDWRLRFIERERPWAGWETLRAPRPLFLIGRPFNEQPHDPGNGQMVAFQANLRETVDHVYSIALDHGGLSEGEPGLRPQYHDKYYGAYFRDTEGNKLCVVCHEREG